jgi:hypothetical protein
MRCVNVPKKKDEEQITKMSLSLCSKEPHADNTIATLHAHAKLLHKYQLQSQLHRLLVDYDMPV